jgi:hypothetical protein
MPVGTCASLDNPYLSTQYEKPAPGGGSVLVDYHFHHDGVSVRPNCDGPVIYLRVRNNSTVLARALLPNKKQGNKWLDGGPGTDMVLDVVARAGDQTTLNNLGLTKASDVAGVQITFPQV